MLSEVVCASPAGLYSGLFAFVCLVVRFKYIAACSSSGKSLRLSTCKEKSLFSLIPTGEQRFGFLSEVIALFQASR